MILVSTFSYSLSVYGSPQLLSVYNVPRGPRVLAVKLGYKDRDMIYRG